MSDQIILPKKSNHNKWVNMIMAAGWILPTAYMVFNWTAWHERIGWYLLVLLYFAGFSLLQAAFALFLSHFSNKVRWKRSQLVCLVAAAISLCVPLLGIGDDIACKINNGWFCGPEFVAQWDWYLQSRLLALLTIIITLLGIINMRREVWAVLKTHPFLHE